MELPDYILPSQVDDRLFGGARIQPEKRLQVAVLADAILTFRRGDGGKSSQARRLFAEADAWFASDDDDGPFTFVTICQSLGLDAGYIRRGLREWRLHVEANATRTSVRRDANGGRHQVVLSRLRRVA